MKIKRAMFFGCSRETSLSAARRLEKTAAPRDFTYKGFARAAQENRKMLLQLSVRFLGFVA
jgi:hypothetical protein